MNRLSVEILIRKHINSLTRQQIKTLKGQLNSGDIVGAYKGLNKILNRGRYKYEQIKGVEFI